MKHKIEIFALFILFGTINIVAQTNWTYPVKPGMEEWSRLYGEDERTAVVQVPKEVLEKITAKELVELCLDLPQFGFFGAFETPQVGFDVMAGRYNIIEHLLLSREAGKYLIAVYKDAGMNGFRTLPYSNRFWPIKLRYIELLLAQKEILQSLTHEEKLELLLGAREKFLMMMVSDIYNINNAEFSLRIMARILDMEEYQKLYRSSNWEIINRFIQTGSYLDRPPVDDLIEIIDNYINEKNYLK